MDRQERQNRDLRVQKTYMALFKAFQELLKAKTFESITVRELCNEAMIRTATFYKHFSDKYDFFAFMVQELHEEFNLHNEKQKDPDGIDYYIELIRDGLTLINENQVLIRAVDSDAMMTIIMESVRGGVRKDLIKRLKKDQKNGHKLAAEPEILAEIFIGSMNQISKWWIAHKNEYSIDEVSEKLYEYINRMIG